MRSYPRSFLVKLVDRPLHSLLAGANNSQVRRNCLYAQNIKITLYYQIKTDGQANIQKRKLLAEVKEAVPIATKHIKSKHTLNFSTRKPCTV
jgi:hypothetical protein